MFMYYGSVCSMGLVNMVTVLVIVVKATSRLKIRNGCAGVYGKYCEFE